MPELWHYVVELGKSMVDITDLTAFGVFIGVFIPLMSAILQYRQSVKQEYEKSFRAIVEKLSAGKKEERVAAASSLGTFIRKSGFLRKRGPFYDESIDVLVNTISIELDHNVLNAIRGSLEKIESKDYRDVIQKLLAIDTNFFVYQYPLEGRIKIAMDDIERNKKEFYKVEASFKENGSKVNEIMLNNLEKDFLMKQEMFSGFERNLAELKYNDEFVTNFISSFLNATGFTIKHLKFYRNSMNRIVLSDLELKQSNIYHSAFSYSTISNAIFNDVTIINSIFTFSGITKSKFINCSIESSFFDLVFFYDVDFSGSKFKEVFFTGADLTGVNFKDTTGLKIMYFYKAKNIDKAKFDNEFKKELDEKLKQITENAFIEYVNYGSKMSQERREDIFKSLNDVKFLFNWDSIPGTGDKNLLDFLTEILGVSWVTNAKIKKSEDDIAIHVIAGEKSIEITLDENLEQAILKTGDGQTFNLQVKDENERLNIYRPLEN